MSPLTNDKEYEGDEVSKWNDVFKKEDVASAVSGLKEELETLGLDYSAAALASGDHCDREAARCYKSALARVNYWFPAFKDSLSQPSLGKTIQAGGSCPESTIGTDGVAMPCELSERNLNCVQNSDVKHAPGNGKCKQCGEKKKTMKCVVSDK